MPSPHSSSTHKDSNQLNPKNRYDLGKYAFVLEVDDTTGGPSMEVTARCTNTETGEIRTKTAQFNSGTEIIGWYVEANDTTADVYVTVRYKSSHDTSKIYPAGGISEEIGSYLYTFSAPIMCLIGGGGSIFKYIAVYAASNPCSAAYIIRNTKTGDINSYVYSSNQEYTLEGKTVYYGGLYVNFNGGLPVSESPSNYGITAWKLVYGRAVSEETLLIARFAIDVKYAGAAGEDSDWEDPEDYDPDEDPIYPDDPEYPDPDDPEYPDPIYPDDPEYPDPDDPEYPDPIEPGDPDYPYDPDDPEYPDPYQPPYQPPYYPPTKTLYLTITGALSGRHNDPLNDTSYSYLPSDKSTIKNHGCGGDGGNGGGGGAGASTVVVHRFATSKANSKEITTIARRHGYGSGGGKGGKGGSGCIIIYY